MSKVYIDYANRILQSIVIELVNDDMLSKLLYYVNENEEDIYSLESLDNPVKTLYKNDDKSKNKVFKNKKILKVIEEIDVCMFINLLSYSQKSTAYSTSATVKTMDIQVGILCHEDCLETLNGCRDVAMIDRIMSILNTSKIIPSIGNATISSVYALLDVPYDFNGYGITISLDGIRELDFDER